MLASDVDGVVTTVGLDHRAGAQIAIDGDGVSSISGGIEQETTTTEDGCALCNATNLDGVVTEVAGQVRTRKGV